MVTDPGEMRTAVRKVLVDSTIAYINAHPTRISDPARFESDWKPLVRLRTSILYRFDSLVFHAALIDRRQRACFAAIEADPKRMIDREHVREQVIAATTQMTFLF